MEVIFYDNSRNPIVRLGFTGRNVSLFFDVVANSVCFEFKTRIKIAENALTSFCDCLKSIYELKEYSANLFSEDENFCLKLSSNDYGQMDYIISVKDGQERCNVHLNIESDLSFIPEMLEQIEEILESAIDNNASKDVINNPIEPSSFSLRKKDKTVPNDNTIILLNIDCFLFKISRNVEITKEEEYKLKKDLSLFCNSKESVVFCPLGEFVNFSLAWKDESAWISGSVSDYQFPYNSIDFNSPCLISGIESHLL